MSDNYSKYGTVSTKPVKQFFVDMLTRDIAVEDAILDLLDNCVDGILRSLSLSEGQAAVNPDNLHPYEGFWAKVTVNGDKFEIEDNCGGIPWSERHRAFRMGRPPGQPAGETPLSVGAYGIGMKRAIFKLGREARIDTQNDADSYAVPISAAWMSDEEEWDLEVVPIERREYDGTSISVTNLHRNISERFASETFPDDLLEKIQSHYAVIISKGFAVTVNEINAQPDPIEFRFTENSNDQVEIRPYIFKSEQDGVEIFVAVGLRDPIPDVERTLAEQEYTRYSGDYAGWTVICNDRVVLYRNRDELTGWGTAGIPRYHTQFIAISGVVEFRGDPKRLPTTTTKRGLDFSSPLYQQTFNRMREGIRLFIDFTNRWKAREEEAKKRVNPVPSLSYSELKLQSSDLAFASVRVGLEGQQYKPKLPMPPTDSKDIRISYHQQKDAVWELAEQLILDLDGVHEKDIPRRVGEESFNFAYNKLVGKLNGN